MVAHNDVHIAFRIGSPSDFSSPGQTQIPVTHINKDVVQISCKNVASPTQILEGQHLVVASTEGTMSALVSGDNNSILVAHENEHESHNNPNM
uniref:Uncharacterized protein n=1 Tax=Medicago truncatula TaxID=3880 RepID=Q2HSS8_MEDTR|nr:hypothetical protein MtrDRAFT_AC151000g4v2 [Medicago truncatula]